MSDYHDPNDPLAGIEPYDAFDEPEPHEAPGGDRSESYQGSGVPPRPPLLTGLVVGLMLVVVSIAVFQLFSDDEPGTAGTDTTLAATDDTEPTDDTGTDGDDVTATDDGTGTTDEQPPVDDTGLGGITGDATPYDPVGDPLTIDELPMAADGLGPIALGQPADQAVGRLVASFGTPDEDTGPRTSVGQYGVCEGDTERIVRWGPLAAIVVVDPDGTETFAGYRLDLAYGGMSHPAADLATLSGLQAARSFRELSEQIYPDFDVRQIEDPLVGSAWELRSSETGNLLLWGPLSDEDVVRGIYSNDACGTF